MAILKNVKDDLMSEMDIESVFQKHVIDGPSEFFQKIHKDPDDEYRLRLAIAKATSTNINDSIIIGSAKLGFSVKTNDFLSFDEKYKKTGKKNHLSDIDIALVNREYFDYVAESVYHISRHFDKDWIENYWQVNQYYPDGLPDMHKKYSMYLARGWLRPDLMPNLYLSEAEWIECLNIWQTRLERKVAIGIYSNWTYLKYYHMDHLEKLKSKIFNMEVK